MRNRGRSDAVSDSTTITIGKDVEDLETIRRHFGIERAQLVGYSYLGMMVIMYTMAHPERVERVIQLGPVPRQWDTPYPAHLTHRGPIPGVDSVEARRVRELAQNGFSASHPKEYCELLWSVSRFGLVSDPERVDRLGASRCDMPNEWPINLARQVWVDAPKVVLPAVDTFLRGNWPAGARRVTVLDPGR
jgi:pimeloyl-ACP methyl ester carboxylesterase